MGCESYVKVQMLANRKLLTDIDKFTLQCVSMGCYSYVKVQMLANRKLLTDIDKCSHGVREICQSSNVS